MRLAGNNETLPLGTSICAKSAEHSSKTLMIASPGPLPSCNSIASRTEVSQSKNVFFHLKDSNSVPLQPCSPTRWYFCSLLLLSENPGIQAKIHRLHPWIFDLWGVSVYHLSTWQGLAGCFPLHRGFAKLHLHRNQGPPPTWPVPVKPLDQVSGA